MENKGFTLESIKACTSQIVEPHNVGPAGAADATNNSNLEKNTQDFFHLYWNKDLIGIDAPKWNDWLCINGVLGEAPPEIRGKAGCYAIYQDSDLLYIGVAVTEGKDFLRNGGPRYGLINRLKRHVISGSQNFVPNEKWNSITSIRWIVFPDECRHLAAALEVYLIKRNKTKYNSEWKDIS